MDVRHRLSGNLTAELGRSVSVTLFGQLHSGFPFTPMVLGDVNGDGRANDPAFIFEPAATADSAVAAGMATLLRSAPAATRRCLTRQLGQVAARNSCTGPWSASLDAVVQLELRRLGLPKGAAATISAANLLGGLDQLFHGNHVRGWGQVVTPDPVLLAVTGFDPAAQRFRYEVNQRFGDTRASRAVVRAPFQITLQLRLPLGPNVERQAFEMAITRVEDRRRVRRPAEEIRQSLAEAGAGVGLLLIQRRDTLLLTAEQITRLMEIERAHRRALDALWSPVAGDLAALPEPLDARAAYAHVRTVRQRQLELIVRYVRELREVLTADQLERLPPHVRFWLEPRSLPEVD
jgi:hypothetical protein